MNVTADGSKGITAIVCVAGSSDSEMPLPVLPVFPVDTVSVWGVVGVATDEGVVGEESPPQLATVPTTNSTATISTTHLRIFNTVAAY